MARSQAMAHSSSLKAVHGQRGRSQSCSSIDLFGVQIAHTIKTALRFKARDGPNASQWPGGATGRECARKECRSCTWKCGICCRHQAPKLGCRWLNSPPDEFVTVSRSEEHTSELQSL